MEREKDQWETFREAFKKLDPITPRECYMLPQARVFKKETCLILYCEGDEQLEDIGIISSYGNYSSFSY